MKEELLELKQDMIDKNVANLIALLKVFIWSMMLALILCILLVKFVGGEINLWVLCTASIVSNLILHRFRIHHIKYGFIIIKLLSIRIEELENGPSEKIFAKTMKYNVKALKEALYLESKMPHNKEMLENLKKEIDEFYADDNKTEV